MIKKSQKGATLIVVLVVLLMITIVGVLAIRVALTSLNISTNAQLGQLLGQTADTPLNQFYTSDVSKVYDISGVIGYALQENKKEPGKEYIFCYRPTSSEKFGASLGVTTLRVPSSKDGLATVATGGADGFCNLEKDFGSSRKAIVTQVAIKIPQTEMDEIAPGGSLPRGTNLSSGTSSQINIADQQRVRITTTSIVPSYATDLAKAQACIGVDASKPGYINDNTDPEQADFKTVASCLAGLGIPVNSQTQEFNLQTFYEQIEAP
ncbi:PilX N-terminal domain-containing pilus assembly protein [Acinetobacter shaoyimingii]|uniref:Type 4 fimbrial biogenesis protein PilX N-terminal domain-containing protein n=1 Tax=Acinetobacter shaoyimingii TaxID=2715164 RepID=A0A6G8RYT0_9GAMM|nr:PilX N-terminal domain-containing pilus assembly protein [Acinetobacter shaoyimingii]QIO07024.1 hypothetical protein G8E00_14310 [Acinetobacter shaoyimingii]